MDSLDVAPTREALEKILPPGNPVAVRCRRHERLRNQKDVPSSASAFSRRNRESSSC